MERLNTGSTCYKKIIYFVVFAIVLFSIVTNAMASVVVRVIPKDDGEYVYFELEHSMSDAGYRYYGYGYTVSAVAPNGQVIATKYLENNEFNPVMDGSVEKVEISSRVLLDEKLGVPEDYLSMKDITLFLNARIGIKKDGVVTHVYDSYDGSSAPGMPYLNTGNVNLDGRTVPLNKDGKGIVNGISHEYGISWSGITQLNLRQHFGIEIVLRLPPIQWDRYKVEYRETSTEKTVSKEKPYQNFDMEKTVTEYPVTVNGYEYSGYYKIDMMDTNDDKSPGNVMEGDDVSLRLKNSADRYVVTFYYNKVDPSQIGKPVTVDIEYREESSIGKKLIDNKTIISGELSQLNLSSEKIDDYLCEGYYVSGKTTEYFYSSNINLMIGRDEYSKPVNGKLKIIFIYNKEEVPDIPKCTPEVEGASHIVNISMKRSDFEKAVDIGVNGVTLGINEFKSGKDANGNTVVGSHGFRYFDAYVDKYYSTYDNTSKSVNSNFNVPKSVFNKVNDSLYSANIEILYGGFCTCFDGSADSHGNYGFNVDTQDLAININIIENKPPKALYSYYTERVMSDNSIDRIYRSYIDRETIVVNYASDPNGIDDIRTMEYTLKDNSGNEYFVKLLHVKSGVYFLEDQNISGSNIVFNGISDEGNLKLVFKTAETWTISQYVEDMEGLNNTYSNDITPEILDLKPQAVITDEVTYRYPAGVAFNGKENRVVKYYSNNSMVATFLRNTGIEINHNRDCWEIVPLDNQDVNKIYFENTANVTMDDNVVRIKYRDMKNTKWQFGQPGRYKIRLQVTDSSGNVSNWVEEIINIHEDLVPRITSNINPVYYRNANKVATIKFNALLVSDDYDIVELVDISYRFDSNNNGRFNDESPQSDNLSYKDVNIGGVIYKEITLTTTRVGKYEFVIKVKENFGQETLIKYIKESDYRIAEISISTEIGNIAPIASIGTQQKKPVDIKILTSGLTGTKNSDVASNVNNLKNWVQSQSGVEVGNIEIVDMAQRVNALNKGTQYRKVALGGTILRQPGFAYIDIPGWVKDVTKPFAGHAIEILPVGVLANGWNGLEMPKLAMNGSSNRNEAIRMGALLQDEDRRESSSGNRRIDSNFFGYGFGNNYAEIKILSGRYNRTTSSLGLYSVVSEEWYSDFDIKFNLSSLERHGFLADPRGRFCIMEVFVFNVKDRDNYHFYWEYNCNERDRWHLDEEHGQEFKKYNIDPHIFTSGIIEVKNGRESLLDAFHYRNDLGRYYEDDGWYENLYRVNRLVQQDGQLEIYTSQNRKIRTIDLGRNAGGYVGVTTINDLNTFSVKAEYEKFEYIENASIADAINNLEWQDSSDKYIINIFQNNSPKELQYNDVLQQSIVELQNQGIKTINIGVNSTNGTKLKSINSATGGTYIELGSIYNNLNSAASYINSQYKVNESQVQYLLLGDTVDYLENYSDAENDSIFKKEYKYNHNASYFENGLGIIQNNNKWQEDKINLYSKTGKYNFSYRVQDNPLYPNMSALSSFNEYRKYSIENQKEIYVHRKPIASFKLDESFKNSASNKTEILEDFNDSSYKLTPIFTRYAGNNRYEAGRVSNQRLELRSYYTSSSNQQTGYAEFILNIPADATKAHIEFDVDASVIDTSEDDGLRVEYGGVKDIEINRSGKIRQELYTRGSVRLLFKLDPPGRRSEYSYNRFYIDNLKLEYYTPNSNAQVKIIENSYDLDHMSKANKGITEWQWKVIDKNSTVYSYNNANRTTALNWVQNTLTTSQRWKDAEVFLRVKDAEGEYSNWINHYLDEEGVLDPETPDMPTSKPIADFSFERPIVKLNFETQNIYDRSYDPGGYPLTYAWTVYKDGEYIFTGTAKDITNRLNQEIDVNGIGEYEVSLVVRNSKGIYSDEKRKSFEVVLSNVEPTVDFDLVSNELPIWNFPKVFGMQTLMYRPDSGLFHEERTRFDVDVTDPNSDNLGFIYDWKLERFSVKDISDISGLAANTFSYNKQYPFTNTFKSQGLPWGAYRITLSVTDKPPVPPYNTGDKKTTTVTKNYYIVPELSLAGGFESIGTEVMTGDAIKLKAKTNRMVENVVCTLEGEKYTLNKVSEDGSYAYWEKNIIIPDTIAESGIYQLRFVANTAYGGNGSITREVRENVPIYIASLKLLNFRITDIVNHENITFPYTKDMLVSSLIDYKAGYYVTFRIDSKGSPSNVDANIFENGTLRQQIGLTKVSSSGNTDTWEGRFYTSSRLPAGIVISIKLDCNKGAMVYDFNAKEGWDGKSLRVSGSALSDGRINLTR